EIDEHRYDDQPARLDAGENPKRELLRGVGVLREEFANRLHVERQLDTEMLVKPRNDSVGQQCEEIGDAARGEGKLRLYERNENEKQSRENEPEQQHHSSRGERS